MSTTTTFTRRGWALLGAAIGLVLGSRLLGTVELSMLGCAALVLLALAWAWARSRPVTLDVSRRVRPARLHAGGEARVDLAIRNPGTRPVPTLTVSDHVDERVARFVLPSLPPGETARAAYRLPTPRRGRLRIGPVALGLSDPFGLARRRFSGGEVDELTVRPRIHDILAPGPSSSRVEGPVETAAATTRSQDGEEFLHLREYEVGDDLRRVHWRTTAHTGALMIRQHEAPWRPRASMVLDTRPHAHDPASFETALEAAASFTARMVRARRQIDAVSSGAVPLLEPGRSGSLDAFLDRLATLEPGGPDGLLATLEDLRIRRGASLVVAVVGHLTEAEAAQLRALAGTTTVVAVLTRGGTLPRHPRLVVVDAIPAGFPDAWNQSLLSWSLAYVPSTPRSRSRA